MSDATPVKRGLTLAWSIGLGLLLLGLTTVLLLPATKNARIRFDDVEREINASDVENSSDDPATDSVDAEDRSQSP